MYYLKHNISDKLILYTTTTTTTTTTMDIV
jgi:hypothetical protein